MKILVDMCLTSEWVTVLRSAGWETVHWSTLGDPRAPDKAILDWARANGHIVFTHDLDFRTLLVLTEREGRAWCRFERKT